MKSSPASSQSKSEMKRRTRSTNKKVEQQNTKRSPIMNSFTSKPISVGNGYQVIALPTCTTKTGENEDDMEEEKDECLWSKKHGKLREEQIVEYCHEALEDYGIDAERSLYILQKCDHNLNKAKSELASRTIVKELFSIDDAFAFRDAHIYFGKNFAKIRQVLPHKTLSALVQHYYLTKKQQNYKSFTDNELAEKNGTSDSDEEAQMQVKSELHRLICENCRNEVHKLYGANGQELCKACKNYFRATNKHRVYAHSVDEQKRTPICPSEMDYIADQFEEMARTVKGKQFEDISDGSGEVQVENNNETVCEQKIKIVSKAQKKLQMDAAALQNRLTTDNKKYQSVLEEARKFVQNTTPTGNGQRIRPTHSWSDTEKRETMNALVGFDGNYKFVAEVIGTKTADMVKSFYERNRTKIQIIINERRKIIEERVKAEKELKKCNDEKIPEIILVDD